MVVPVCQTCGVSGYSELLVYCSMCESVAEHQYCLGKLPHDHEDVCFLCDECKYRSSTVQIDQSRTLKGLRKLKQIKTTVAKNDQRNNTSAKPEKPHHYTVSGPYINKKNACSTADGVSSINSSRASSLQDVGNLSESSSMVLKGENSKKQRRKLILLEDEQIDEDVHTTNVVRKSLSEGMKPINMSGQLCHGKNLKRSRRRLDVPDEDYVHEEPQVNQASRISPIKSHSQTQASLQVEKDSPIRKMTCDSVSSYHSFSLPAQPIIHHIWRGYFDVCYGELGPLKAHPSSKACENVWKVASKLPPLMEIKKFPRLDLWPKSFKISPPNDDNIALYFFAEDARVEASLNKLLDDVIREDIAFKVVLDEAELLAFSSTVLPEGCQYFLGKCYLWGLFKRRKDLVDNSKNSEKEDVNCFDENAQAVSVNLSMQHSHSQAESCPSPNVITKDRQETSGFNHAAEQKFDDITENSIIIQEKYLEEGEIECDYENSYFVGRGGEVKKSDCLVSWVNNLPKEQIMAEQETTMSNNDGEVVDNQKNFGFSLNDEVIADHQLNLFPEKVEDMAITSRLGDSKIDLELGLGRSCCDQKLHHECMSSNGSPTDLFLGSAFFL
ncbi:hypothetical protein Cni_G23954 [Canna indica]|uniref:AIPP2-like SPOC-like domain-containing protein n=1 Tax=Canna indica TaxID=4628 RepID=A0AAQ3KY60_9LILI|nr:hypothetical protein Cni_G23954 [Canna indica]